LNIFTANIKMTWLEDATQFLLDLWEENMNGLQGVRRNTSYINNDEMAYINKTLKTIVLQNETFKSGSVTGSSL